MANSCEMKFQDTIFKGRALTSVIVIADAKKCEIIPPLKIVLRLNVTYHRYLKSYATSHVNTTFYHSKNFHYYKVHNQPQML